MAKTSNAQSALPYVQRLLEDEYVQEQLRDAAKGLRNAYGRAARQRAQATDDKKLYASLRRAATSIRNATTALRKPEPPPKRRVRKVLIIALAAMGAALLTRLGRHQQHASTAPHLSAVGGATPPAGAEPEQPETVTSA